MPERLEEDVGARLTDPSTVGDPRHIVLLGLMGSGKSVVGRALAERTGRPFLDNDELLEADTGGATAEQVRATEGEPALHGRELAVLRQALALPAPSVVTAAASVIDRPEAQQLLAPHLSVWLTAEPSTLAARVEAGHDHRPLAGDRTLELLRVQAARRHGRYGMVADLVVDTTDQTPEAIVDVVADAFNLT